MSLIKRLLSQEWEVIAGILAAVVAIILHFLHYTDVSTLLAIALVLIALLFLHDLRQGNRLEKMEASQDDTAAMLRDIKESLISSDIALIGPAELRSASEQFARKGQGEVVWVNVCLRMFKAQEPFNIMLKPFIDNLGITSVRFVLNEGEKERWYSDVVPKVKACSGGDKVEEPCWIKAAEQLSFVIVETKDGKAEALISFWGEPFMAVTTEMNVPRYIIHIKESSELIPRLKEYERICRLK